MALCSMCPSGFAYEASLSGPVHIGRRWLLIPAPLPPVVQPLQQHIEHRHERNRQKRRRQHPPEHDGANSLLTRGARPEDTISGTTPRMNANEVITIGRNRRRVASTAASA